MEKNDKNTKTYSYKECEVNFTKGYTLHFHIPVNNSLLQEDETLTPEGTEKILSAIHRDLMQDCFGDELDCERRGSLDSIEWDITISDTVSLETSNDDPQFYVYVEEPDGSISSIWE